MQRLRYHYATVCLSICALAAVSITASAQIALSANDGKQPRLYEKATTPVPDNVAVIDLGASPPRVIGKVDVPTSMIGPPAAVAVAHSGKFALVSNAKKINPSNAAQFVLDNRVSVIDLAQPIHPRVIQTLDGGPGATGISFNRDDTLALVAATGGSVTAFSVSGKKLAMTDRVQLNPKDEPVDVAISPDGKTALVTQEDSPNVVKLAIEGTRLRNTGIVIPTGYETYGVVFSPDGRFAYNTNLGGRFVPGQTTMPPDGGMGTVTVIDVAAGKVVNTIDVGVTPEYLTLSRDGKYIALTIGNGSSSRPGSKGYHPDGLLKIFKVDGATLTEVAETKTGGWGQGAAWNSNHSLVLQESGIEKDIEVFRFDGKSLTPVAAKMQFDARPGSIATAFAR